MGKIRELYYEDAYIKEFDALVTGCEQDGKGSYLIELDATAFFPEQGGQNSDIGFITVGNGDRIRISHVSITNDGGMVRIFHHGDKSVDTGLKIHGEIDYEYRFSNMQQHTGEHIFSGIVNSRFGYDNVGFHLSDQEVTMDYSGPLSKEEVSGIEDAVNRAIWENVAVVASFPDADELMTIDYRSKKELFGDIRIVTVEGYDVCACCAPHVSRTGEIGLLKVVGLQNYKGGVRISILCGKRALEYLKNEHEILNNLATMLTTATDKVIPAYNKLSDENARLKDELRTAQESLMEVEIAGIDPYLSDVFLFKDGNTDASYIRKMVNGIASGHSGYCGVFAGSDSDGYRYIIASGTSHKDLKIVQDVLKNEFSARGGGNKDMIQGSMPAASSEQILTKLQSL